MDSRSPCSRGGVSTLQDKCLFPVGVSWPLELYFLPTSTSEPRNCMGRVRSDHWGEDKQIRKPRLEKAGKHRVGAVTLHVLDPTALSSCWDAAAQLPLLKSREEQDHLKGLLIFLCIQAKLQAAIEKF